MDVTYIYPPLFKPFYPMATRIITENLLRNRRLNVTFSDMPVRPFASHIDTDLYSRILSKAQSECSPNVVSFLNQKYMVNNIFYVFMAQGYFDPFILTVPDTDIIILTCLNFCDLLILRHLLEKGKRVVVGGPLINIGLSPSFLRGFIRRMGVQPSKIADNLIIVSGNIDLSTDLHPIISGWRDAVITQNDYGTVYDCKRDFLKGLYSDTKETPVHLGFSNHCWYGRCKFCTYRELPRMDFLKGQGAERVSNAIRELMNAFDSDRIRFIDSYFRSGSPLVQEILSQIQDYYITVYTGITLLKKPEYIEFLNRSVDCLLIGLESTSDFSLRRVNKGYSFSDIEAAVANMIQYMSRDIFLEISLILDLPARDEDDVKANYERIARLKARLAHEGFRVAFHMNILSVFPNMELLGAETGLLRPSTDLSEMNHASGKNYLIDILRRCGMERPLQLPSGCILRDVNNAHELQYGYISSDVPVVRYDVNGHILPSDLELMDESTMQQILTRTSRRKQTDGQ